MSPIDIQDILERARDSSRVGDHEKAEQLLKNYLARVPGSREARLLLGTAFAKEGKLSEAADEFIKLLARDPQDIEALNNAAVICRRQGKYQDALGYLTEAIDIEPNRVEFHYNIGNIHKQLGNSKAASMAYARVIELDPGYTPAYNNLGTIYEQLRDYEKAFNIFRKGLALDQNNPTLRFNYGVALEANGSLEEAAAQYRAALRSKPGWLNPMNNLGIILFKQGHHDKALSVFNRILNSDPFNAEARNNVGVVLADQGRTQEAIKSYRQAIEADPTYTKAVVNLERALEASGDFSNALAELEKLVKLSPASAEIRNRLGGLYLKMERYPEALEQAEAALEWEPESIQSLRIKGTVKRIMGNDEEAQACFETILSLDPGNYSFLLDIADIHFKRKEYKEAEERIKSYLVRRPNDRNAKLLLGKLYAEMGNRAHAIQVFEDLSRADPNDTEALAAAAELHKNAGSLEKALRTADTLVNLQGKRATANDLSELNKSLEFYENAVSAYSTSVREMWDRNIKTLAGIGEEDAVKDDISMLMDAAGVTLAIDEEMESLFTEGPETFADEEDDGEMPLGDEPFGEIPEEPESLPRYRDPLDALAEDTSGIPRGGPKGATPGQGLPPSEDDTLSSGPQMSPEMDGSDAPGPQMPALPEYPDYPSYPAQKPARPPGVSKPAPVPEPAPPLEPEPAAEPQSGEESPLEPDFPPLLEDELFPGEEAPSEAELMDETEAPGTEDFSDTEGLLDSSEPTGSEEPFGGEEPILGEEIPEDIFSDGGEPIADPDLSETEPQDSGDIEAEAPSMGREDEEELAPGIEETMPLGETETLPREESPVKQSPKPGIPVESTAIPKVIGLLNYLKSLTGELPDEDRNSFSHGKFPAALKRVIDSLGKLVIIKESAINTQIGGLDEAPDGDGDVDGSGS